MSPLLVFLEAFGLSLPALTWWLMRRYARRNVAGELIAGAIVGVVWEIATEPLWDYHLALTFYRDAPVAVVAGWSVMLALVPWLAEKIYCKVLGLAALRPRDKRIFIFDIVSAAIVCLPLETLGAKCGVWTYRQDLLKWDWGLIPLFGMPYELLFGYSLLMLVAPTFVRYWEGSFEGGR